MAAGISAGTAFIDILPNMAQFAAATATGMRKVGQQLTTTGARMTRGLTIPLIGAGAAITKLSLDFNDALTNIRALVGASDKQIAQYREGILRLAGETTKGPTELAQALYFLTSAGFAGKKALDVLGAAARASSSGLGDTQQVAQLVGAAVNAYGEKALSAADATDVLVATVREGTAEPAELAGALGRVIAPAQAVGVEFKEVGGAVAGLTLTGLDAAESVTALRGILVSFLGPGNQAKETLKKLGTSAKEVQEGIAKDGLLTTLQGLRDRFDGNNDAMRKLFPNVRAFNGFLALTGRNAEKNSKAMDAVTHSTGDADKAFEKASESLGFKFRNAMAKLQVSLLKFGDILLPLVAEGAAKIATLGEAFAKLDPSAQKMIVWGGIVLAALGPVLYILGSLTKAVSGVIRAFIVLEETSAGATVFAKGWAVALATNPWFLMAAAVAGVTAAIIILNRQAGAGEDAINGLTDATRNYVSASTELNASSKDLKQARIDEQRTALAVKDAHTALTKTMNDENSTTRQVKQSRLQLTQAELDHVNAVDRLNAALGRNRHAQSEVATTRDQAKQKIDQMTQALFLETGALKRNNSQAKPSAAAIRDVVKAANPEILHQFVDGLVQNAAAFQRTRASASKARGDIYDFIKTTGQIPTQKELQVIVDSAKAEAAAARIQAGIDRLHDKTVTITLAQRGTTAAIGTNAAGTDDWRGGWSWVGERGPELLNVPKHSQVVPNHKLGKTARGGRMELIITNWEDGTGYIESIADDSVESSGRLARQTKRMQR